MLFTDMRAMLRSLGVLGATLAVLSTVLPWYSFGVTVPVGGVLHVFAVPITLWGVTTLAPILIVLGATAALVCFAFVTERWAGAVEALVGLGITAYAVIRCFDIPNLAVGPLVRAVPGAVRARTMLEAAPFLAIASGLLVMLGSLADLRAPEEKEPAPGAREDERFRREEAARPSGRAVR